MDIITDFAEIRINAHAIKEVITRIWIGIKPIVVLIVEITAYVNSGVDEHNVSHVASFSSNDGVNNFRTAHDSSRTRGAQAANVNVVTIIIPTRQATLIDIGVGESHRSVVEACTGNHNATIMVQQPGTRNVRVLAELKSTALALTGKEWPWALPSPRKKPIEYKGLRLLG